MKVQKDNHLFANISVERPRTNVEGRVDRYYFKYPQSDFTVSPSFSPKSSSRVVTHAGKGVRIREALTSRR